MFGTYGALIVTMIIGVLLSVGGVWVVRRYVDHQTLTGHHDVAAAMLSVVGTLYAVVLGLIVVGALNKFEQARLTVEHEANSLHDIFHLSKGLPAEQMKRLRQNCLSYAQIMVADEWNSMEKGVGSPNAHKQMADIWNCMTQFQPKTQGESNVQQSILAEIDELGDARHTRLLDAKPSFVPIIWTVLIVGAFVLVIFTYFFGVENMAVQVLMTALVTVVLSLNMIVIALFGTPYSGDVKVSANPFADDVVYFQQELRE